MQNSYGLYFDQLVTLLYNVLLVVTKPKPVWATAKALHYFLISETNVAL